MTLTDLVERYISTRDRFVLQIAEITRQLNEWTEAHRRLAPSLIDIAHFEGLRAERARLLAEFSEAEDEFVIQMLHTLGSDAPDDRLAAPAGNEPR